MSPKQMERTLTFIAESHASAMIRMDRFDEELREQKHRVDALVESVRATTGENNETFKAISAILLSVREIQATQSERLRRLEERGK